VDGVRCTANCTFHSLTITNTHSEGQFVHIGAHVWAGKGYSEDKKCESAYEAQEKKGRN